MQALALSRHSLLIVASFILLFAVTTRSGGPLSPAREHNGVSIQEAIALIDSGALVIDVRESPKTHIPGALLIPLEVLNAHLSKLEAAKAQSIVVYCGNGTTRGPEAAQILTQAGFAHVVNLQPGIEGWRAAGLPVASS
jgi:rhodanese-related sulfurtransferase